MAQALAERDSLEAEFASIKKDFKTRIDLQVSVAAAAGATFRESERTQTVSCDLFEDRTTCELIWLDSVSGLEIKRRKKTANNAAPPTPSLDQHTCLAFANLLMRVMPHDERVFLPLLAGVYTAAHWRVAYASHANSRLKHKLYLSCGSISEQWEYPVCGNEENWLTGVNVPEISEETEAVDATENVSLPNLSFADFPPEKPVQHPKWEVFFDGREDDIFKATGLARPTL